MLKVLLSVTAVVSLLTGCETPTSQRYTTSVDNQIALKKLSIGDIGIRTFVGPADFSPNCRVQWTIKTPDDLNFTQYIQRAFEDELRVAGSYAQKPARVTIGGSVSKIEFSSIKAINTGYWKIDLTLRSSNGREVYVSENYEFSSGYMGTEACRNTAEAFPRAVQNLVGNAVKAPGFNDLIK